MNSIAVQDRASTPLPAPVIAAAFDGGLGHYDLKHDLEGELIVASGPWLGFIDGDVVEVLWGDAMAPVGHHIYATATDAGVARIGVPNRTIIQIGQGEHPVYVRVTPAHSQMGLVSPARMVLVKFDVPGGLDPQPDSAVNEGLASIRVTPERPVSDANDVTVTIDDYRHRSDDDRITVSWAGEYFEVKAATPGGSIEGRVDPEIVKSGGNGRIAVTYFIRDRAGNSSQFAPYTFVEVGIGGPDAPPAPWVEGTVGDKGLAIELGSLGGSDLVVHMEGHGAAPGDSVTLHWRGFTASGTRIDFDATPIRVSRPSQAISASVPYATLVDLGQGSAMVRYSVAGATTRTSLARTLEVLGEPARLLPPEMPLASGGVLDPSQLDDGVTVFVRRWPGASSSHRCTLEWRGIDKQGGRTYYNVEEASGPAPGQPGISFRVPAYEAERIAGGSLKVRYVVSVTADIRSDAGLSQAPLTTMTSPDLALTVAIVKPSLSIDSSNAQLAGILIRLDKPVTIPPHGSFVTRLATGGTPPYRYAGSNGAVDVDAATGRVMSLRNGKAVVTVTDAKGATASYPVAVSNVGQLVDLGAEYTWEDAAAAAARLGGNLPSLDEWQAMRIAYGGTPDVRKAMAWSSTEASASMYYAIEPNSGEYEARRSSLRSGGDDGEPRNWPWIPIGPPVKPKPPQPTLQTAWAWVLLRPTV